MLKDDFDYEVGLAILLTDGTWFLEEVLVDSELDSAMATDVDVAAHLEEAAWECFLDKFDPPDDVVGYTMLWYQEYEGE